MQLEFFIRADAMQRKEVKKIISFFGVREYYKGVSFETVKDSAGRVGPKFILEGFLDDEIKNNFPEQYAEYAAFKSKNEQSLDNEARANPGVFVNVSERMKAQPKPPAAVIEEIKPVVKPRKVTKDDLL